MSALRQIRWIRIGRVNVEQFERRTSPCFRRSRGAIALTCGIWLVCSAPSAAAPPDSAWEARVGWWCGGASCDGSEPSAELRLPMIEAVWLRTADGRACGFWHSRAYKLYRGLIVGSQMGRQFRLAYSQEIDHSPAFYEAKHFSDVPPFSANEYAVLESKPSEMLVRHYDLSGRPNGQRLLLRTVADSRSADYGPSSEWESEFMAECMAGSNSSIERARNALPPLRSSPVEHR